MSGQHIAASEAPPSWWDSDLVYDFLHSPVAIIAALITLALALAAIGADVIAPYDSSNPAAANVIDARLPPGTEGLIGGRYLRCTDPQGRHMPSATTYRRSTSPIDGFAMVLLRPAFGCA